MQNIYKQKTEEEYLEMHLINIIIIVSYTIMANGKCIAYMVMIALSGKPVNILVQSGHGNESWR